MQEYYYCCIGLTRYLNDSLKHTARIPDFYAARATSVHKTILIAFYADR